MEDLSAQVAKNQREIEAMKAFQDSAGLALPPTFVQTATGRVSATIRERQTGMGVFNMVSFNARVTFTSNDGGAAVCALSSKITGRNTSLAEYAFTKVSQLYSANDGVQQWVMFSPETATAGTSHSGDWVDVQVQVVSSMAGTVTVERF